MSTSSTRPERAQRSPRSPRPAAGSAPSAAAVGGAREQVARLLTLVPLVHRRDGVRLGEAADLLGITPAQLLRDLKVLFLCGLPGGLPDDLIDVDLDALESEDGGPIHDGVIRVRNADYLTRPLRLTATEASALQVALHAMRDGARSETAAVIDGVLSKLAAAVEAAGPAQVEITSSPLDAVRAAVERHTAVLQEAIAAERPVRLRYFVPSRQEESERVVEPYGVVERGAHAYLDGWCRSAGGDRLFRLDRVREVEVLDGPTEQPRRAPRDAEAGMFDDADQPGARVVRLVLDAPAAWAADYYPVRSARPRDDGGLEVELVVVDQRWLERLLMRLAPDARVLDDDELAENFTSTARHTLRLYEYTGVR